jgi:DNA-binding transcriptional LysR family regulator
MIEFYLLEHLYAFQKYGTLSSAAEYLNISQPSLSRSMKKLEDELGVSLFERSKNKIELSETGLIAADYARRLIEEENEMIRHVRAFDRSLHTLTVGSCAPGPLMFLLPSMTRLFSDMTVSSAVVAEEKLIDGLKNSDYTFILLSHPLEDSDLCCTEYQTEQLFLSVPPFHPAAAYDTVSFSDLDGQNFIMYAYVGIWDGIVRQKMPHSKFFVQEDMDAVGELARYSDLPSFSTDITMKTMESRQNGRVNIPFSDEESRIQYYLICRKKNEKKLQLLLRTIP